MYIYVFSADQQANHPPKSSADTPPSGEIFAPINLPINLSINLSTTRPNPAPIHPPANHYNIYKQQQLLSISLNHSNK